MLGKAGRACASFILETVGVRMDITAAEQPHNAAVVLSAVYPEGGDAVCVSRLYRLFASRPFTLKLFLLKCFDLNSGNSRLSVRVNSCDSFPACKVSAAE